MNTIHKKNSKNTEMTKKIVLVAKFMHLWIISDNSLTGDGSKVTVYGIQIQICFSKPN